MLKRFLHLIGVLSGVFLLAIPATAETPDIDDYNRANQYYESGDFANALVFYEAAVAKNPELGTRFPKILLKIGYCLFQTGQFEKAAAELGNQSIKTLEIGDYADFFAAKSLMASSLPGNAASILEMYRSRYPNSPMGISADSMLAEIYFQQGKWQSAKTLYSRLIKYRGFDKGEITGRLMHIAKKLGNTQALTDEAFTLMKKYPFHPQSRVAYREIRSKYDNAVLTATALQNMFSYLAETEQYPEMNALLKHQEKLGGKSELLRWLKIRKLYEEKQYWGSLQAAKAQRDSFVTATYKRHIDLNFARCYLRMGLKDKAIEAYDTFQKRYPSDALAAEVLWVIAWLSEEQGRPDAAREYYQRLITSYSRYELTPEARFRIGLSHFRDGEFEQARGYWKAALNRKSDDIWNPRMTYWIAKSYAAEGNDSMRVALLSTIIAQPFDNYYTMKAFLTTQSTAHIHQLVDSLLSEIHHKPVSYLPKYLNDFQRPLLVQEVFGENYAQRELNVLAEKLNEPGWELTFALGEMNERLQNFGRAYRYYQRVYLNHFVRSDWKEWIFLFKNLYPLYFNSEVNTYARKWNITPASIWAVMKKESAFEPQITSYANAYGLMQIIPPTADRLSESLGMEMTDVRRLFEPDFNILLGSYYLSELLKRYDGNMYHALAAYNAGEHRVDRWRKVYLTDDDDYFMENIEYEQTRQYVRGVMKYYWLYHLIIHPHLVTEELADFPAKVAREPWFRETGKIESPN